MRDILSMGDADPILWHVSITKTAEIDVFVWADNEEEAGAIAVRESTDDMVLDYDTSTCAGQVEMEDLEDEGLDLDERPYGECPEGMAVASERVGDTLRDALQWMSRGEERINAYQEAQRNQISLFDGVKPAPLPCPDCLSRYPAEAHSANCPSQGEKT